MNKKILAILRVSTDLQELRSQKNDMLNFLTSKGYSEEEIEWIEAKGASARKANKKYLDFIEEIKQKTGGENGIKTVALWHLNRLGRIKYYLTMMEHYFVTNQIQMYCKNGFDMPLLDEKGKETLGASIAFSVYASMIEIETEEMIEKMRRGKKDNALIGKYNGGKIHFGYSVDDNGKFFINPQEAELIKLIFNLYNSGEYSTTKLTKELQERGYKMRGKNISLHFITNMLKSTAFIGFTEWNGIKRQYPRIISDRLFKAVQQRLTDNHKGDITRQSKHVYLASKLIVCPDCGRHWFASNRSYCCIGHKYHGKDLQGYETCSNGNSVSIDWVDSAVWQIAKRMEINFIFNYTQEKAEQTKQQIEINKQKIVTLYENINGLEDKKKRINEVYIDGSLSRYERDKKINGLKEEENKYNEEITNMKEENNKLSSLISQYSGENKVVSIGQLSISGIEEEKENSYKITHKHIKKVTVENYEYNKAVQKIIIIETITGEIWKYLYIPKSKLKYSNKPIKLYLEVDGDFKPLLLTPDFVPSEFEFLD